MPTALIEVTDIITDITRQGLGGFLVRRRRQIVLEVYMVRVKSFKVIEN
jgi:hypothetical protein